MEGNLKVEEGVYIPSTGMKYPDDPFERLVKVDVEDSSKGRFRFDETYRYLDDSFGYKINQFFNSFVLWGLVSPYNLVFKGLKFEGRENLKDPRLRNGAVSICNHCFWSDAACVYQAVKPFGRMWIPMYGKHFNGKSWWIIKYMGGIPVAETLAGSRKFSEAFDELHARRQWIHVFPEEVRWNDYKAIRPFRKGAFAMAYKYDVPIVPCVLTYRERRGIYRLFGKKSSPLLTIKVGKPVFPDKTAPRKSEIDRLRIESHAAMERMAGIIENPWPAIPEDE